MQVSGHRGNFPSRQIVPECEACDFGLAFPPQEIQTPFRSHSCEKIDFIGVYSRQLTQEINFNMKTTPTTTTQTRAHWLLD